MKKASKATGIILYAVNAVLFLFTLIINYKSVSENLDGFHGFSSEHAMVFAILCLILMAFCIYILISLMRSKVKVIDYVLGLLLIILPFVFLWINVSLPGNVKTDMQGLMLRTCQGFENTYLYLIIASIIGYIALLCQKIKR